MPMRFTKELFKNWLTIGMHKNVAVPMRLAKRHDLTKSQISMQIYQNHATRHDLVHSLYQHIFHPPNPQKLQKNECFLGFHLACFFHVFFWLVSKELGVTGSLEPLVSLSDSFVALRSLFSVSGPARCKEKSAICFFGGQFGG